MVGKNEYTGSLECSVVNIIMEEEKSALEIHKTDSLPIKAGSIWSLWWKLILKKPERLEKRKWGFPDRGNSLHRVMEMRLKLVYSGHRKKFSIVGTLIVSGEYGEMSPWNNYEVSHKPFKEL